jgi:hypothetical protein
LLSHGTIYFDGRAPRRVKVETVSIISKGGDYTILSASVPFCTPILATETIVPFTVGQGHEVFKEATTLKGCYGLVEFGSIFMAKGKIV